MECVTWQLCWSWKHGLYPESFKQSQEKHNMIQQDASKESWVSPMKGSHVGVGWGERFVPFTDNTLKSWQVIERENIHFQIATSDTKMATSQWLWKHMEKCSSVCHFLKVSKVVGFQLRKFHHFPVRLSFLVSLVNVWIYLSCLCGWIKCWSHICFWVTGTCCSEFVLDS